MKKVSMTRMAALAVCGFMLMLPLIPRAARAPHLRVQHAPQAGLKEEVERVQAEIDTIFDETLAQLPSIPRDAGHRMKRVQTLGKLLLFDKQLYGPNLGAEYDHCRLPGIGSQCVRGPGSLAIRSSETAKLHILDLLPAPPVQPGAG
jgi:hypothetical protein